MNKMKLPVAMILLIAMVIVFPVQAFATVDVGKGGTNAKNIDDGFIMSAATEDTYVAPAFDPGDLPNKSYFFTTNPVIVQDNVSVITYQGIEYHPELVYVTDGAMTQITDTDIVNANGKLKNDQTYFFDAIDGEGNPLEYYFSNSQSDASRMISPAYAGIIGYDRSNGNERPEFHKEGLGTEQLTAFKIDGGTPSNPNNLYVDNICFDGDNRNMVYNTQYGCGLVNIGNSKNVTLVNCTIKDIGTSGSYYQYKENENCRNMGISITSSNQVNLENISMSGINAQQSSDSSPLRISQSIGVYVNHINIDMSAVGALNPYQLGIPGGFDFDISPYPVKIESPTTGAIVSARVWIDDLNVTGISGKLLSQANMGIVVENYKIGKVYVPEEYRYSVLGSIPAFDGDTGDLPLSGGPYGIAVDENCLGNLLENPIVPELELNFEKQMVYDNVDNAWIVNEKWKDSASPTIEKQFNVISEILDKACESNGYPSEVWYKYIFDSETVDEISDSGFKGIEIPDLSGSGIKQHIVFSTDLAIDTGFEELANDLIPVATDASFVLPENQLGILHNLDFTMSEYEDGINIPGTMSRVLKGISPIPQNEIKDPLDTAAGYPYKYSGYVKSYDPLITNGTSNSFRNCKFDGLARIVSVVSPVNVAPKTTVALKASVPGSNNAIYTDTVLSDRLPQNISIDRSDIDSEIEWFIISDNTKSGVNKGKKVGSGADIKYTIGAKEGTVKLLAKAVDKNNMGELEKPYQIITLNAYNNVTKIGTPMTSVKMKKGKTYTPGIVLYNGKNITSSKLTFTSSNPKVASVNSKGKIKAVKKGKATITVKSANGKALKIKVNVVTKTKALKSFKISGVKSKLKKGKTANIKIKVKPTTATITKITFKSNKQKVIKVDKAGKITAVKKGKATITVTVNGKKVKKTIKVV